MKKIFGLGLLALTMSLTSCSGDDSESTNNNNNTQGTITATINGEEWTGTIKSATLLRVESMGQQRFDITAEGEGQRIQLACSGEYANSMALETYMFDAEGAMSALFTNAYLEGNNSWMVHFPETGEITLTSFNSSTKKASGTFEFTAYKVGNIEGMEVPEDYIVTDGEFTNVTYVEYNQ